MKISTKLLIAFAAVTLSLAGVSRADSAPFTVGNSYKIFFAPTSAQQAAELPTGAVKITATAGDWIKIEYSVSSNKRNASDPGKIDAVSTPYTAWVNLDQVVALIEAPKAE